MFLENINISFIKTIIYPLYDINKYVSCKGLNIHLIYIYYTKFIKKQNKNFEIEKQSIILFFSNSIC